jgi:hypothetical protein
VCPTGGNWTYPSRSSPALEPLLADIEERAIRERELAKTILPEMRKIEAALKAKSEAFKDAKYALTPAIAAIDRLFQRCFDHVHAITAPLATDLPAMRWLRADVKAGKYVPGSGVGHPASNPIAIMWEEILRFRRPELATVIARM